METVDDSESVILENCIIYVTVVSFPLCLIIWMILIQKLTAGFKSAVPSTDSSEIIQIEHQQQQQHREPLSEVLPPEFPTKEISIRNRRRRANKR